MLRLIITVIFFVVVSAQDCIPVDFGRGGTVCECNATYCDYYPDPLPPTVGQFIWYVTSKDGKRLQRSNGEISDYPESNYTITINSYNQFQSMEGFGGAFTDSAGINMKKLSKGCQDNIMRSYFSTDGSKYNLGRVPIAGTDFSTRPYTYDDSPGDTELKNFALANEDYQYKIPFMSQALEINPSLRFVAGAWTAPPWMKKHKHFNNFDYLLEEYYQVYVNYIIKFFEEYKKNGFDIWTLSTGNEPFTSIIPHSNINSMYWSPDTASKWVTENLGPTLRNSSFASTEIIMYEDQRLSLAYYMAYVKKKHPDMLNFVKGIAVHWYTDGIVPFAALDATHQILPDKFMLMTESCLGSLPHELPRVDLGSWSRAEKLIKKVFENINHWIVGWIDWNLALDRTGGPNWVKNYVDAFIIVNPEKDVFYKQPMYYAFMHFSKFVPRYSVRVESVSADQSILSTAFLTTIDQVVVILYNRNTVKKNVTIIDENIGSINLELPASSLHTILYKNG